MQCQAIRVTFALTWQHKLDRRPVGPHPRVARSGRTRMYVLPEAGAHPVVKSRHMDSHYQIVPIHAFQSIFESSSGQSECFSLPTYSVPCNMRLLLP